MIKELKKDFLNKKFAIYCVWCLMAGFIARGISGVGVDHFTFWLLVVPLDLAGAVSINKYL